jgi:hypothetical protein
LPSRGGIFGMSLDTTNDMFPSFDMERTSEHARESISGSLSEFSGYFTKPQGYVLLY